MYIEYHSACRRNWNPPISSPASKFAPHPRIRIRIIKWKLDPDPHCWSVGRHFKGAACRLRYATVQIHKNLKSHETSPLTRFLERALALNQKYHGARSLKVAVSFHLVARTQSCMGDFRYRTFNSVLRIRDAYHGSWFFPIQVPGSRFPDPTTLKRRICYLYLFLANNFTKKIEFCFFFNRYRNFFLPVYKKLKFF